MQYQQSLCKAAIVILVNISIAGCAGGGGDENSPADSTSSATGSTCTATSTSSSRTAAQLFSVNAVGNTWTTKTTTTMSGVTTTSGITTTSTNISTVTSNTGGTVTRSGSGSGTGPNGTTVNSPAATITMYLDTGGALISTTEMSGVTTKTATMFPATYALNTSWSVYPSATGTSTDPTMISTITALDVTRAVPAGTFTDLIEITSTITGGAKSVAYYSPSAGATVEKTVTTCCSTSVEQLQAGYVAKTVANPTGAAATGCTTGGTTTGGTTTGGTTTGGTTTGSTTTGSTTTGSTTTGSTTTGSTTTGSTTTGSTTTGSTTTGSTIITPAMTDLESLISDATSAAGILEVKFGQTVSATPIDGESVTVQKWSLVAPGIYSTSDTSLSWSKNTASWQPVVSSVSNYVHHILSSSGWITNQSSFGPVTISDQGDGSAIQTSSVSKYKLTVSKIDLSGNFASCANPLNNNLIADSSYTFTSLICAVPGSYPPSSVAYIVSSNQVDPIYAGQSGKYSALSASPDQPYVMTSVTGANLAYLPVVGDTFCVGNKSASGTWLYGAVWQPNAGYGTGIANYSIKSTSSCNAADIAAAIAQPFVPSTATYGNEAFVERLDTGKVGINVLAYKWVYSSGPTTTQNFMAIVSAGKYLIDGVIQPAGSTMKYVRLNKAAANAQMQAMGVPVLPF